MKRIIAILLAVIMCFTMGACGSNKPQEVVVTVEPSVTETVATEEAPPESTPYVDPGTVGITVSLSIAGEFKLTRHSVTVRDYDTDGALTINDGLLCAHEAYYPEGTAGFGYADQGYGLSVTKLWGVENGGSYGYCQNNSYAQSLLDPISEGSYLAAFSYSDMVNFSDVYCWFEGTEVFDGRLTLTLYALGFDEEWKQTVYAIDGARIIINGTPSEFYTDADGLVTIQFYNRGHYQISAECDGLVLVPPILIIEY